MRVISGTARGRRLTPVPGSSTRPTTDKVKESIFNIIQFAIPEARVLDLFAGTGQLGIEALSRGAAHCDFVDHDRTALAVVKKNIAAARVEDRARTHQTEAARFLSACGKNAYDLILLDPPYGGKILNLALFDIERFDILSTNGIIICESAGEDVLKTGFTVQRTYHYGTIKVTVLARKREETDAETVE